MVGGLVFDMKNASHSSVPPAHRKPPIVLGPSILFRALSVYLHSNDELSIDLPSWRASPKCPFEQSLT